MNALVLRMKVWLRAQLHYLRIRILGKNAEERSFETLAPRLAEAAGMSVVSSPQELATSFLSALDFLREEEQGWQRFAFFACTITGLPVNVSPQQLIQACFEELDRRLYRELPPLETRTVQVARAWEVLRPYLESLARGAHVSSDAPPEELATGAVRTLSQLVEHYTHLDERDRYNRRYLRLLVEAGVINPEHARTDQGIAELRQALAMFTGGRPGQKVIPTRNFSNLESDYLSGRKLPH